MAFNPDIFKESLYKRDFNFFISPKEITEIIFNRDEIILTLIKVLKSEIPDFTSFIISAMGASGSDEYDMYNSSITLTDQTSMLQKINDFQNYWKLDLAIETYVEGEILYTYETDTDPDKKGYGSEISYAIETSGSFVYFYTNHFYY